MLNRHRESSRKKKKLTCGCVCKVLILKLLSVLSGFSLGRFPSSRQLFSIIQQILTGRVKGLACFLQDAWMNDCTFFKSNCCSCCITRWWNILWGEHESLSCSYITSQTPTIGLRRCDWWEQNYLPPTKIGLRILLSWTWVWTWVAPCCKNFLSFK